MFTEIWQRLRCVFMVSALLLTVSCSIEKPEDREDDTEDGQGAESSEELQMDIPDREFLAYLLENFDTDGDGNLSNGERRLITHIDCRGRNIVSLLGIESIVNLERLDCSGNKIEKLEMSGPGSLRQIDCSDNLISEMGRISGQLEMLDCSGNRLTDINLTDASELRVLVCDRNSLERLEFGRCTQLELLSCADNRIGGFFFSDTTPALRTLRCQGNLIEQMRLDVYPALTELQCWDNMLYDIDASACRQLQLLQCGAQKREWDWGNRPDMDVYLNNEQIEKWKSSWSALEHNENVNYHFSNYYDQ